MGYVSGSMLCRCCSRCPQYTSTAHCPTGTSAYVKLSPSMAGEFINRCEPWKNLQKASACGPGPKGSIWRIEGSFSLLQHLHVPGVTDCHRAEGREAHQQVPFVWEQVSQQWFHYWSSLLCIKRGSNLPSVPAFLWCEGIPFPWYWKD